MSNRTKLLTAVSGLNNTSFQIDQGNLIAIDTSNNRIGINTIDPGYSIHVNDGTIKTTDLIVDDINTISFSQLIEDLRQLYRDISNTDGITLNRDSYTILKD
jgi:hypothetical protein|tara:strand:+ start:703 stop:1008 length:306 start_codon:yes stop_codon:yes gene_type:complete